MFNLFRKNQEESPLSKLLKSFSDIRDKTTIDLIVRNIIEDKINPALFEINLCYLWNKELRPVYIMKLAQLETSIEGDTFKKEHKQQMFDIASKVNKTTEKIACNITLGKEIYFFPKFANELADSNELNKLFWFFAAYPDVFDYFFPLPDVLSKEWESDALTYMYTVFDEVVAKEGYAANIKLEGYIKSDSTFPGYENINIFLLYLKNYYTNVLKKTLDMTENRTFEANKLLDTEGLKKLLFPVLEKFYPHDVLETLKTNDDLLYGTPHFSYIFLLQKYDYLSCNGNFREISMIKKLEHLIIDRGKGNDTSFNQQEKKSMLTKTINNYNDIILTIIDCEQSRTEGSYGYPWNLKEFLKISSEIEKGYLVYRKIKSME